LIRDINKTVAIDLRQTLEEQRAQFRKGYKTDLNKLRSNGFEVIEGQTKRDIDAFTSIMKR
jgi:hypothetical protein